MRLFSLILVFVLMPSLAFSEPLSVAVGKESTWVNLETGDLQVNGRRVRKIEIDTALVRDKCVRAVDGFEGFVRLRHETRDAGWMVRVECMQRVEQKIDAESARPIESAQRDALEPETDSEKENS